MASFFEWLGSFCSRRRRAREDEMVSMVEDLFREIELYAEDEATKTRLLAGLMRSIEFFFLSDDMCWDLPDLTTLDGVPENGDDTEGDEEPVEQVEQVNEMDLSEALWRACGSGQVEKVHILLASNADLHRTAGMGMSPLYIASAMGHGSVVSILLQASAAVDHITLDGMTALYVASVKGAANVVECLLNGSASVNQAANDGTTPLFVAAELGHDSVVEVLLERKASVNTCATNRLNALMAAIISGRRRCVQILCEALAERAWPDQGLTARDLAVESANHEIVEYLDRTQGYSSRLHFASSIPRAEVLQRLRAGENISSGNDPTPLQVAIAHESQNEDCGSFLVIAAAQPWSPRTNVLFPQRDRAHARALLVVGSRLGNQYGMGFLDAWVRYVLPMTVIRTPTEAQPAVQS